MRGKAYISLQRRIQRVPALHVSQLFAAGTLPSAPPEIVAASRVPESRDPTLAEFAALTWLLCGPLDAPCGVASYRDVFDHQTSSDVREIIHIAGSKRAVYELGMFLIADALPRRCIGTFDCENPMIAFVKRLGASVKRVRWESR